MTGFSDSGGFASPHKALSWSERSGEACAGVWRVWQMVAGLLLIFCSRASTMLDQIPELHFLGPRIKQLTELDSQFL